jgi:hypothetical protein
MKETLTGNIPYFASEHEITPTPWGFKKVFIYPQRNTAGLHDPQGLQDPSYILRQFSDLVKLQS